MVEFAKILKKSKDEDRRTPRSAPFDKKRPAGRPPKEEPRVPLQEPRPSEESSPQNVREEPIVQAKPMFVPQRETEPKQEEPRQEPAPRMQEAEVMGDGRSDSAVPPPVQDFTPLYEKLFSLAVRVFDKNTNPEEVDTNQLIGTVAEVAGAIAAGDEKLVELALVRVDQQEGAYLVQHAVNVCILALVVGFGLNYEMERLIELGLTAFLHDIGMTAYEDMSKLPRKLTANEFEEIKKHVEAGDLLLRRIRPGLGASILEAQCEIHERVDGSGYPKGKKVIHEYARIIALTDSFESMMHPRPFRPRYSVTDVYKRILDAKSQFDQNAIKVLVDRIGFFPNGSFVQLNTMEVARVLRQNPRSPLRPLVRILYGPEGVRLEEEQVKDVNLDKYPTLHVKRCFMEEKLLSNES